MPKSAILFTSITYQKSIQICLVSLMLGKNRQFTVLLAFCQHISFMWDVALIMFLILLAWWRVSGHISCLKYFLLIKTIQTLIFEICLDNPWAFDDKCLIFM